MNMAAYKACKGWFLYVNYDVHSSKWYYVVKHYGKDLSFIGENGYSKRAEAEEEGLLARSEIVEEYENVHQT